MQVGGVRRVRRARAAVLQHQRNVGVAPDEVERGAQRAIVGVVDRDQPEQSAVRLAGRQPVRMRVVPVEARARAHGEVVRVASRRRHERHAGAIVGRVDLQCRASGRSSARAACSRARVARAGRTRTPASDCDSCGRGGGRRTPRATACRASAPAAVARAISDSSGCESTEPAVLARHEQPRAFRRSAPVRRSTAATWSDSARGANAAQPSAAARASRARRRGERISMRDGRDGGSRPDSSGSRLRGRVDTGCLPRCRTRASGTGTARDRRGSHRTCCPGRGRSSRRESRSSATCVLNRLSMRAKSCQSRASCQLASSATTA